MNKKEFLQAPDGASEAEDLLDAAAGLVIMRGSDCDRVVAEKMIQALKGLPCTCGSGAMPYRCKRHPFAYDAHVRELNVEAELANRAEDAEERTRELVESVRLAIMHADENACGGCCAMVSTLKQGLDALSGSTAEDAA